MEKRTFSAEEIKQITEIVNNKFLKLTDFRISDLNININKRYFFNSSQGEEPAAYVASFSLTKDEDSAVEESFSFTTKTSADDIAFHLAHHIWGRFDKRMDNQLWNNLDKGGRGQ